MYHDEKESSEEKKTEYDQESVGAYRVPESEAMEPSELGEDEKKTQGMGACDEGGHEKVVFVGRQV